MLKDHMDMQNRKCDRCEKGRYKKMSVYDDEGNVYCTKCQHKVYRFRPITKGRKNYDVR